MTLYVTADVLQALEAGRRWVMCPMSVTGSRTWGSTPTKAGRSDRLELVDAEGKMAPQNWHVGRVVGNPEFKSGWCLLEVYK